MIAQGFGFTGIFLNEWNNNVYCRVSKEPCKFKEQARDCHSCEKFWLNPSTLIELPGNPPVLND